MRYQGSEAYSWDAAEGRRERSREEARPSFEVVTGGGLDARARQGVSPQFVRLVVSVVATVAFLAALNAVSVFLTSQAVATMRVGNTLKAEVETAQSLRDDLKIERAVLSSNSRISRIATQNYGMVLSSGSVALDLSEGTDAATANAADDAAAADSADAAEDAAASLSGAPADGDAAQSTDEAAEPAPVA